MSQQIETGVYQPIGLSEKIDTKIQSVGKFIQSKPHMEINGRGLAFLQVPVQTLIDDGILDQFADSFPYAYQDMAQVRLTSGSELRVFRMTVVPEYDDRSSFASVWRAEMENGKDPRITFTDSNGLIWPLNSSIELLDTFGKIVDRAERQKDLNYYINALMVEVGPKILRFDGWRQSSIEIQTEGLGWSPKDIREVIAAMRLAWNEHEGVKRKSGEPYFLHPFEGAMNLLKLGITDPTIIKAVLVHDVAEDSDKYKQPKIDPKTGKASVSYQRWVNLTIHKFARIIGFKAARWAVMMARPIPDGIEIFTEEQAQEIYDTNIASSLDLIMIKVGGDRWHNVKTLEAMPKLNRAETIAETRVKYLPLLKRAEGKYPRQVRLLNEDIERMLTELEHDHEAENDLQELT